MTFKKNREPWNKGVPMREEIKRKISKSSMGKKLSKEHKKKISESLEGKPKKSTINYFKPKSAEQKKNIRLALKRRKCPWMTKRNIENNPLKIGSKNPNWRGGVSFEPYNKSFNNKFKRAIRKRDNQICMLCGIHREKLNRALDIHHINYDKKLSIPQNCISLCMSCHTKTNFNRKHWIKFFQSFLSEKYNYQYLENKIVIRDER